MLLKKLTMRFVMSIIYGMERDTRHISAICPYCFHTLNNFGFCPNCRRSGAAQSAPDALPMRTLLHGRYLLGNVLGKGGFGITYNAWDSQTSSRVALKEFFPSGYVTRAPRQTGVAMLKAEYGGAFTHWLNAFIDEAKVLSNIAHLAGVVKIKNFFTENNTAYIAMEFLDGISLRQYLSARGGKLPLNETLHIMRPVLEALLTLHQYGVIHKDISPENIQIVQNREVKLIDFGAASIYNRSVQKPYIILKHGFSPIELYRTDLKQGPWSDIYQAGATIYNCLTGIIPPPAPNRIPIDKLVPPSAYGIHIPVVRENALMKAMRVNAKERYTNMGEFIQMIYGEFMPPPLKI